jgi:predicted NodU family carbamoyl transferase
VRDGKLIEAAEEERFRRIKHWSGFPTHAIAFWLREAGVRHEGYGLSQSRRAMTECIFAWGKQHGTMRKTKHRGIASVAADFMLNLIAYNLIRIPKLPAA